jgi:hypothetical protein
MKCRIRRAYQLPRADGETIATVAQSLGFCDQSNFTHHVHEHTGRRPAAAVAAWRGTGPITPAFMQRPRCSWPGTAGSESTAESSRRSTKNSSPEGFIGPEQAVAFEGLYAQRLDADYGDFVDIPREQVANTPETARRFVAAMQTAVDASGRG